MWGVQAVLLATAKFWLFWRLRTFWAPYYSRNDRQTVIVFAQTTNWNFSGLLGFSSNLKIIFLISLSFPEWQQRLNSLVDWPAYAQMMFLANLFDPAGKSLRELGLHDSLESSRTRLGFVFVSEHRGWRSLSGSSLGFAELLRFILPRDTLEWRVNSVDVWSLGFSDCLFLSFFSLWLHFHPISCIWWCGDSEDWMNYYFFKVLVGRMKKT